MKDKLDIEALVDGLKQAPSPPDGSWEAISTRLKPRKTSWRLLLLTSLIAVMITSIWIVYHHKPQNEMNVFAKTCIAAVLSLSATDSLAQNVGVGTATPDPSAKLDVESTNTGFLRPRLTTVQRDAIASPARGLSIYNTDTDCMEFWNGTKWISSCADVPPCSKPPASLPSANSPVCVGSDLNLSGSAVGGATYIWSGPNGFSSTGQDVTRTNMAEVDSGTYTLRTWLLGCYSDETTVEVDVRYNPWTSKADYPGSIRTGISSFTIGSYGYFTGGRSAGCVDYNNTYRYDPATNSWLEVAPIPTISSYSGSFSMGGLGYVTSGHRNSGCTDIYNTTYEYNPGSDTWTARASHPNTHGNHSYSFYNVSDGTNGYFGMGGTKNDCFVQDFSSYNPGTNTWTTLTSFPGGVRGLQLGFVVGGKLYFCAGAAWGGWAGGCPTVNYSDLYEYDPGTGNWTAMAAFPGGSGRQLTSFAIGSNGYVINPAGEVYQYIPASNSWTQLPCLYPGTLGTGRRHATVVIDSKAYIIDGVTAEAWEFSP